MMLGRAPGLGLDRGQALDQGLGGLSANGAL
jgi:hypothetical protein